MGGGVDARAADPFGWAGATIANKYTVEACVGEGGFGVVYRGHHHGLGVPIAIKCLKIDRALSDDARKAFLQAFLSEGRLLHRLSRATSSIVQAMDMGAATSPQGVWTPYLILEWLDGETLETAIARRFAEARAGFGLREATSLIEPIARGLDTAHAEGIAHRDVKPANVFLARVGTVRTAKLLDFGIAKVMADSPPGGTLMGEGAPSALTPRYAAPEQFDRSLGATGPWTDVYSLARILVESVVGHGFEPGLDTVALFRLASDSARRPTLGMFGIETTPEVERVLAKALAVDPRNRYARASEFWDALSRAVAAPGAEAALKTRVPVQTLPDAAMRSETAPLATIAVAPPAPVAMPLVSATIGGGATSRVVVAETPKTAATIRTTSRPVALQRWALAASVLAVLLVGTLFIARRDDVPSPSGTQAPDPPEEPAPTAKTPLPVKSTAEAANDGRDPLRPIFVPGDPEAHEGDGPKDWGNRCFTHLNEGFYGYAKAECDKAMTLSPASPWPLSSLFFNLGLIEKAAGHVNEARGCFQHSILLKPIRQVIDALDALGPGPTSEKVCRLRE